MTLRVIAASRREGICKDPVLIAAPLQENETACWVLNHSVMWSAEKLGVACVADCIRPAILQWTVWRRIAAEIKAAMILARANLVNVHRNRRAVYATRPELQDMRRYRAWPLRSDPTGAD